VLYVIIPGGLVTSGVGGVDELPRLDFYVPPTPELEVLPDTGGSLTRLDAWETLL
jgi:hypothetical protein